MHALIKLKKNIKWRGSGSLVGSLQGCVPIVEFCFEIYVCLLFYLREWLAFCLGGAIGWGSTPRVLGTWCHYA